MLLAAAAVDFRGVARHDEAMGGGRLHLCDDYVGRCSFQCTTTLIILLFGQQHTCGRQRRSVTLSYGGTLSNGYHFGANEGLSLSGTGIFDVYSIDIHLYFDDINASFNGYERILDFKSRAFDEGLYNRNGRLEFFVGCCSGPGGTGGSSAGPVFPSGQLVDLLVTRSATGVFSAYVNGNLALSFLDSTGLATFSGPDNVIYFFMDDFESLHNFPTLPEAGSGFVDFIQVTTPAAAVPGPIVGAGLPGLLLGSAGVLAWWRRRQKTA